ncbi:hypothetical protein PybrP1_007098 [[Pythium] brassicae (nom. inval.)]|nr:hypothetical protein PybrP1_007098 [[Pythium] brassicae (nom. inval.)]
MTLPAGVTVVLVVAPPSMDQPPPRAHVALVAGMAPVELSRVISRALRLPAVCGFLVADDGPQKRRATGAAASSAACSRVVPLSLACVAPELLTTNGSVTALVTLADANAARSSKSAAAQGSGDSKQAATAPVPADSAAPVPTDAAARVARFVAAVSEDKALSKFEAAVLAELCAQQPAHVLRAMRSGRSIAQKQQFLLDLAHFGHGDAFAGREEATPVLDASSRSTGSTPLPQGAGATTTDAQAELVYQKLVAVARSVFSPQAQAAVLDAAAAYRAKKRAVAAASGLGRQGAAAAAETGFAQKMELLAVLERLLSKHALPEEQVAYLVGLVLAENRLLLSALQSYRLDCSAADLEKAVKQIAALGPSAAKAAAAAAGAATTSPVVKPRRSSSSSPRKSRTPVAMTPPHAAVVRPIELLHALHQKQLLTSLEFDILGALVKQQDAPVLAAVAAFQRSRDVAALREALVAVVEEITTELGDDEKARFVHGRDKHEVEDEDQQHEAEDHASVADWQTHLTRYVRHWAARGALDPEYAAVLEALVAARHNLLQSAFEVFASDEDETELLDTLQRIGKLQLQAEEGAALQRFSQVVNAHCDVLRESEKALVKQLFVRRNELVRAAWEVFELEQNVHDLGDTLLRIARFTSRNDSKLRLVEVVGEMLRRQLIRSHEADGLIRLYEEQNAALRAANEAFEADGDTRELVETLLLVVKHADFGAPPVCSPRHLPRSPAPSLDQFEPDTEEFEAARVVEQLARAGRVSAWQRELLLTLLGQSDDRLLAALDVLADDADLNDFVDTVARLCDLLVWEENTRSLVRDWVLPLEAQSRVERGVLARLIDARDDRILAAFIVFLDDSNADEFADTLERIARIAAAALGGAPPSAIEMVDRAVDADEADGVLAWLSESGLISGEQWAEVQTLLNAFHAQVLAAFDVYHATKDSEDLADTLQRILVRCAALKRRAEGPAGPSPSKIGRMEKQLLHFATELGLAPDELVALKRSIARQDEILEAAVEVYEAEQDEEDLKDTLKRVAHHIVGAGRK